MRPEETTVGEELKAVWTHSRVYALAAILNRSAGFVLVPVYAHALSAADFGIYAVVVMLADLVAVGFSTALTGGMVRVYFDYEAEKDRNRVVSTTVIALGLVGLAVGALLLPLGRLSSHAMFGSPDFSRLFALGYLGVVFTLLGEVGLNYFRLRQKSWIVLWASCGKVLLFLGLNIYFVVVLELGVTGILLGTLISSFVLAAVLMTGVIAVTGVSFSRSALREVVAFGLPLLPAVLADTVMDMTDKAFLSRLASASVVGAYSLGGRVAALLHLFISVPFAQIWVVRRFEQIPKASDHAESAPVFTYFVIVITTAGLATAVFAPEIVRVVSSAEYQAAVVVVPFLVLSFILVALKMQLQMGLYQAKQTGLIAANSLISAAVSIPLTYVLVARFGLIGAAVAALLTSAFRAGLMAWFGFRYCRVPPGFEWRRVMAVIALAAVTYLSALLTLGTTVSVAGTTAKIGALAVFLAFAVFAGIGPRERKTFSGLIRAWLPAGFAR